MLGKLLKYEVKSTARIVLPLCGLVLVLSGIMRGAYSLLFHLSDSNWNLIWNSPLSLVLPLGISLFGILITGVFVTIGIITIYRFYKNLLGDEGYLMFTLPVTTHQNVLSKLLVSMLWSLAAMLTVALTMIVFFAGTEFGSLFVQGLAEAMEELTRYLGISGYLLILELFVGALFSWVGGILSMYVSLALGHLLNKLRLLASIGIYLGLTFVMQIVSSLIQITLLSVTSAAFENDPLTLMHINILPLTVLTIIATVLCYLVTVHILNRRLNLE